MVTYRHPISCGHSQHHNCGLILASRFATPTSYLLHISSSCSFLGAAVLITHILQSSAAFYPLVCSSMCFSSHLTKGLLPYGNAARNHSDNVFTVWAMSGYDHQTSPVFPDSTSWSGFWSVSWSVARASWPIPNLNSHNIQ
jgi:hypothetical protein